MESPPVPLTPSQVARLLGVSAVRVRQLCVSGKLACTVTPLGRLIDPEAVAQLIKSRAEQGAACRIAKDARDAR